ncbi:hypothetical protein ELI15_14070 [Rhizobium ruizarguesonis]|uniref:hypothetical protein n=1 Tax=Rhizobium ruizarguesonis TaxID=2081791 RepID=UPI00102FAF0C|nr:hypothetical protein [Rhizobium ruizarguesonis]TAW65416.1 hypothetical protein ELI15_14070 [Rhizobium ruizarguesonis]
MINLFASVVIIVISTCPTTAPVPVSLPAAVAAPVIGSKEWCLERQAKIRDSFIKRGMTPPADIHTCTGK